MWYDEALIYQIYPLGLCGAPKQNDGITVNRISRIKDWVSHIKELGFSCVLFNPLMQSDAHGYDTRDYFTVDCRLGTNEDLQEVCKELHDNGIKIIFDGVFNHVGRGFWAFEDVRNKKWDSPYKDWFKISFDGNSAYNDGFWYEGWEGHYELVKLNLYNPFVKEHIYEAIRKWIELYDIDGLRLDVAYCLDVGFLGELRHKTSQMKQDFVLIGETLHGDYNRWMNDNSCHSVTNYECYKGLYSSFNTANMHEIGYSLNRQFGSENWCIYRGKHLLSFLDNHDVSRIATILGDKNHIKLAYALTFTMPGVPAVYYGSEWGMEGDKNQGDHVLRPDVEKPIKNDLSNFIKQLCEIKKFSKALNYVSYRNIIIQPKQLVFERVCDGERIIVLINASNEKYTAYTNAGTRAKDLLSGEELDLSGAFEMEPYSCYICKAF